MNSFSTIILIMPKIFRFYDTSDEMNNLLVEKILNASRCEARTKKAVDGKESVSLGLNIALFI
jgi:hypothetical protein